MGQDEGARTRWPAWATEQVALHPPDTGWQQCGERECQRLDAVLGRWLLAPVEHVGSTAVPGVAAKPILDLQAAVADLACAPRIATVLAPTGWHHVPPALDRRPWRRSFVQVIDGHRSAHLHLMTLGSPRWDEQLTFRDALRADRALAQRYAALKQRLVARHADDREAYTTAKSAFIRAVLDYPQN